jgi:hypothetical protein
MDLHLCCAVVFPAARRRNRLLFQPWTGIRHGLLPFEAELLLPEAW